MEQTLKLLIQLQEIDTKLRNLEKMKGNLPEEVLELKKQHADLSLQLADTEQKLNQAAQDRRHCEMEVKTLETQMAKYKQQIYAVKTNKEYDALTAEIETTEIEISDLETQILEYLELEETLQPQIVHHREMLQQIEISIAVKEKELSKLLQSTEQELTTLQNQRQQLLPKIPKPVLGNYERVRKAKEGLGVVPIDNGICTGCFSNLPPQTALEIKRMNQLITCQTCGRFLIWEPNENNNLNHT